MQPDFFSIYQLFIHFCRKIIIFHTIGCRQKKEGMLITFSVCKLFSLIRYTLHLPTEDIYFSVVCTEFVLSVSQPTPEHA